MSAENYRQTILEWRKGRDESIRRENNWLALAGLFWLKLGRNRIGSDPNNEIQLPERAPGSLGVFDYDGKSVTLRVNGGNNVMVNGKPVNFAMLQPDTVEEPSFIDIDDIRLVVIQRGNRLGIRMWDNQREARRSFPTRIWYDVDENFLLPARYTPYDRPKTALFPDMSGENSEFPVDGFIAFNFEGKEYRLDVTKEDDDSIFVRFWDPTSETEAYPTGRYLVADVDQDGNIELDFNRAYNPPCAFTDFATCVFAPEQNRLDFKVLAGEKFKKR
jgi:uncharacterized protein (DUF1684 family)